MIQEGRRGKEARKEFRKGVEERGGEGGSKQEGEGRKRERGRREGRKEK